MDQNVSNTDIGFWPVIIPKRRPTATMKGAA